MIEKPAGGVAAAMTEEFSNVYDKTGPAMSNYKPQRLDFEAAMHPTGVLALR